jgi:hypothetical protein
MSQPRSLPEVKPDPERNIAIVLPLVTAEEAQTQWRRFEDLKQKLLIEEDYQTIQGRRFIKRSGFRKLAVVFGLSDRVLQQERLDRPDGSFVWRVTVEIAAPNGRTSIGMGACDSKERNFAHTEHDVLSVAHTRSKSRGISDMVAGGAVSAEEMEATPPQEAATKQQEKTSWEPRDPCVKEPIQQPGLRQFPLVAADNLALGMVNYLEDGSEASLVPEQPIPLDHAVIKNFLLGKVLRNLVDQKKIEFQTEEIEDSLTAVLIRGKLDDAVLKDIVSAARWAFEKALEG